MFFLFRALQCGAKIHSLFMKQMPYFSKLLQLKSQFHIWLWIVQFNLTVIFRRNRKKPVDQWTRLKQTKASQLITVLAVNLYKIMDWVDVFTDELCVGLFWTLTSDVWFRVRRALVLTHTRPTRLNSSSLQRHKKYCVNVRK